MSFLTVKNLKVHYPIRGGFFNTIVDVVRAVDGVDMVIEQGKSYGLIGESGSGKTTIGKAIVGLEPITSGEIIFKGEDVSRKRVRRRMNYNEDVQMIFQDSRSSLDPKKRVYDIIGEPLRNFKNLTQQEERMEVLKLLHIVGMPADAMYKYPFEFSGGQRQRIGVARAVATQPKLIIADEPTSALDLSVQAQVLNYMKAIQEEYDLTYLFISHDLGVVRHMCDNINIMHRGRFVETGTRDEIYNNPKHIYTKRLIAAIPEVNPNNREELRDFRLEVEKEYTEQEEFYYKDGYSVYDLVKVNDSHRVALPEDKIIEVE